GRAAGQELILYVRTFQLRPGLHEQADRAGTGHQRALARQNPLGPGIQPAQPVVVDLVHRHGAIDAAIDDAPADMVLQILANPRQVVLHLDPQRLQQRTGADSRQLQNLRGVDGAAAEQHLPPRRGFLDHAVLLVADAGRALALHQHLMGQRVRLDPQIAPAFRRAEIAPRGRAAAAAFHRQLQRADAFLFGPVEVGVVRIAGFLRTGDEGVVQRMVGLEVRYAEWTAFAVVVVGTALLVLGLAEIRQHVVVRPAGVAELAP